MRAFLVLLLLGALAVGCGDEPADDPEREMAGDPPTDKTAGAEAPGGEQPSDEPKPEDEPGMPTGWPSAAERRLEAGHAPTPYTPEQIRSGCRHGLRASYVVEGGGKKMIQVFAFDNPDEEGVDFTLLMTTEDGAALGEPLTNRVAWTSLQRHADFPAAHTMKMYPNFSSYVRFPAARALRISFCACWTPACSPDDHSR